MQELTVGMWLAPILNANTDREAVADYLQRAVSVRMATYVTVPGHIAPVLQVIDGEEIAVKDIDRLFRAHPTTAAIIEVTGYPYERRMLEMEVSLERIGSGLKTAIGLTDEWQVSVAFIPIPIGCWVSV